jgi:hypothetical protein
VEVVRVVLCSGKLAGAAVVTEKNQKKLFVTVALFGC